MQKQPIDVLLLGSVLKVLGDLDHGTMMTYAIGVLLGLGVELPRTPAVLPPKTRWSLPEQVDWRRGVRACEALRRQYKRKLRVGG